MDHRRAAYRAWRTYRGQPLRLRAFLAARLWVLPLKPLADELRRLEGRVLGVGPGHGLIARYAAELNPRVEITGIDVDAERVAVAQATEANAPRVRIRVADVRRLGADAPAGVHPPFDAAAAVDLMHHIPPPDRTDVARALAAAVRPGGTLLIKEIARTPRWKHAINRAHDRLIANESTEGFDPQSLGELFDAAGFETERIERVAPLSPYPHFILRARRRG